MRSRLRPLCLALALLAAPVWAAPDIAAADRLVRAGKAEEAWALLSPHEFDLAGREDFDYLLGVAALESGRAARATLVFERVLAVNPNHAAARLDMARAYFALGDYDRAKAEFLAVLRFDPPPPARAVIDRYLSVIADQGKPARGRLTAYAEFSHGTDSNVTAAPAGASYYLPVFAAEVPSPSRSHDRYFSAGAGLELTQPLGGGTDAVVGADFRQRSNAKVDTYDTTSTDVHAGLVHSRQKDQFRLMLARNNYDLDNAYYRRTETMTGEWRHAYGPRTQSSVFVQHQRARYLLTQAYSGDQLTVGIGGIHVLDPASGTFVFGSAYVGDERATDQRLDGDKYLVGAKVGIQRALRGNLDAYGSFGLLTTRYDARNILFSDVRREFLYDLAVGANWRFAPDWSLKPQVTYSRNDANFGVYDYDRYDFSLTLRRDFR